MRCPHCASSRITPPLCRVCGKRVDDAVEQPVLPGLEVHRVAPTEEVSAAPVPGLERTAADATPDLPVTPVPGLETTHEEVPAVAVERMPGLVTTEEALGDTRIPDDPALEAARCPRCNVDVGADRFCSACGYAVAPIKTVAAGSTVVCGECGVPNPPGRKRCMSCGNRM